MKIWGVTGWKNTGKTGLTERLVAEFVGRGLRVSTIKHAHHSADVDHPGTDSFRHRGAGASEVILATPARIALMRELRGDDMPSLDDLIAMMQPVDLLLIEGYKSSPYPKVETQRVEAGKPLLCLENETIKLVATDTPLDVHVPQIDLNDTSAIADFIAAELGL